MIITLLIIIAILGAIRTEIVISHSTDGIELGDMQGKIKDLDTKNMLLQTKLEQQTALTNIDKKARKMGFIDRR